MELQCISIDVSFGCTFVSFIKKHDEQLYFTANFCKYIKYINC